MSFFENIKKPVDNSGIIKRFFIIVIICYIIAIALFYFLAGEQLFYRESRGSIPMRQADVASIELVEGTRVEQAFIVEIDRIKSIDVQFGAYYRTNTGTVQMSLVRQSDQSVLLCQNYDAATITENLNLSLIAEDPIEGVRGQQLLLQITADSMPGKGVTPLVSLENVTHNGFTLTINNTNTIGLLCFSVQGQDYIWLGKHFFDFATLLGIVLSTTLFVIWKRFDLGYKSHLASSILAIKKYDFLIKQLVERDFKTRYKRSVLGIFWSVLNPLLTMVVQYIVFSTIFKNDIPHFAVYLLIGVVMFNFFSESTNLTSMSILSNSNLITKVYMPKYIYPFTRTLSSMVNLTLSLIPLIVMCLITGVVLKKAAILSLFFFICLVVFTLGLGLLLSTSMVFFRDTQFLWGVLCMMWMYATPIFYPESILPDSIRVVLKFNPLYYFIKNARLCIMSGLSPEPFEYVRCLAISLTMLIIGIQVFRKQQHKFVLFL